MRLYPEGGDDRRLRMLVATLSTVAAFGMIVLLPDYFTPIPFLPASLAALSTLLVAGVLPAVAVEILLTLATVYFLLPPAGSFAIPSRDDVDQLLAFMALFALANMLGSRLERARRASTSRERVLLWETCDLLTTMLHAWTKVRLARLQPRLTILEHQLERFGEPARFTMSRASAAFWPRGRP